MPTAVTHQHTHTYEVHDLVLINGGLRTTHELLDLRHLCECVCVYACACACACVCVWMDGWMGVPCVYGCAS